MIPLIEREITENNKWIQKSEFLDLLVLAQSSPGPISLNTSVFVGYKMRGYIGAIAAITGLVLPPFVIILVIAIYFPLIQNNKWIVAAFKALRPAVVALMIWPVISLAKQINPYLLIVVAIVTLGICVLKISPIWFLLAGALTGLGISIYNVRKEEKK